MRVLHVPGIARRARLHRVQRRLADPRGDAEIGEHRTAIFDEDVVGLHVAVDDAGLVGEVKRARKLYEQSIAAELLTETDRAARTALARLAKRDGDFGRALELWQSAVGNSREGYEAYEQLAIYFEHRTREPRMALELVREAIAQLHRANQEGMIAAAAYRRTKAQFEHRLARLDRKAGAMLLDV